MNTNMLHQTQTFLSAIICFVIAASLPTIAQPSFKATLELGKNQAGKVLEYYSASRMPNGNIRYEATIDGRKRVVTYKLLAQERTLLVSIDDGSGGAAMEYRVRPIVEPGGAGFVYQKIEWIITASGVEIGKTISNKNDQEILIRLNQGAKYDAYSMDILLHLPNEIKEINPGDLVGGGGNVEAQSIFKKLLDLILGGAKYERDCQKTKVKVCKCSAACTQAPNTPPGECSCADCCGVCCGGSCDITEVEQRNCSATVSVGKSD